MGSNHNGSNPNSPSPDGSSAPPAVVPSAVRPSLAVPTPSLSPDQTEFFRKTILFGKIWGDYIPAAAISARLLKDWSFIIGDVTIRYLAHGWFLIKFSNSEDRDEVWNQRPWFVQGLNFVLQPWKPRFRPFSNSITHVDQWVKIPFLPNEYWSWDHLSTLMSGIGTLIKLDKYTLQNDEKPQFARVCVNIDIFKPVPCSLSQTSEEDSMDFFLSYEGIHEVCPLCGAKDHSLVSCPQQT